MSGLSEERIAQYAHFINYWWGSPHFDLAGTIRTAAEEAARAERERCAKICESKPGFINLYDEATCDALAATIRGQTPPPDAAPLAATGFPGDTKRLEWVMRKVSGKEWRRLGANYGDGCDRSTLDNAIREQTP
jgi:hypothetical protein